MLYYGSTLVGNATHVVANVLRCNTLSPKTCTKEEVYHLQKTPSLNQRNKKDQQGNHKLAPDTMSSVRIHRLELIATASCLAMSLYVIYVSHVYDI